MMTESSEDKPKIIIDEDWKSQVEKEREQARDGAASSSEPPQPQADQDLGPLPPPTFDLLVTTLATETMACLGQIPDPIENKPVVHLKLAQHHIDMLAVLQEKTKGNLTPDEDSTLDSVLHQLRMLYVSIQRAANS